MRQLAAAFLPASLLAGLSTTSTTPRSVFDFASASGRSIQQAGWCKSGSKLPHSKASLRQHGNSGV